MMTRHKLRELKMKIGVLRFSGLVSAKRRKRTTAQAPTCVLKMLMMRTEDWVQESMSARDTVVGEPSG